MADIGDNLNPYQRMVWISGKTVDEAFDKFFKLKTPVTIFDMKSHEGRFYIFLRGDIRIKRKDIDNG